ncbi:MAG: gamma-glutamylcyclotransferase [Alphaproteobacteria bacterium]|nr:gamma-glutamylcyclotransferase [Alphaproteobacteria bacterium]
MAELSWETIRQYYPDGAEGTDHTFLERAVFTHGLPSLFYGSLRDERVFERVAGRPLAACRTERVTVVDHKLGRIMTAAGYPGIFPEPGGRLECLLVHDLAPLESARIAWYEWDEYRLEHFPLSDGRTAEAFVPDVERIRRAFGAVDFEPWSFENWRAVHYDHALTDLAAWMALMPAVPHDDPRLLEDDGQDHSSAREARRHVR